MANKSRKATKRYSPGGGSGVCWVDPATGGVVCSTDTIVNTSGLAAVRNALADKGGVSSVTIDLILQLAQTVINANAPDGAITARQAAIVGAVAAELSNNPPSVLNFHWSLTPRDVWTQYFSYRLNPVGMQNIYDAFSSTQPTST